MDKIEHGKVIVTVAAITKEDDGTNSDEDLATMLAAAEAAIEAEMKDPPTSEIIHSAVINKDIEEKQNNDDHIDNNCSSNTVNGTTTEYQLRTIRPNSISSQQRIELLPAYPQTTTAGDNKRESTLLLLANVADIDRETYEKRSYCGGQGVCPFEFRQYRYVERIDSFMIDFYRDLFMKPSRQWKIDISLIDYNLSRLQKCMDLYTEQTGDPALLSLNEMALALEFYLQIDVDIFFMKTCNFRGSQPRLFANKQEDGGSSKTESEGILCQGPPKAAYGMTCCFQQDCFLCKLEVIQSSTRRRAAAAAAAAEKQQNDKSPLRIISGVHFCSNQIHRFINKYEAILNCPSNCRIMNIIYALTCPCGQYDYIDATAESFHDQILKHRSESNRILREFLIGFQNMDHIFKSTTRSPYTIANNNMLLYQHSPRCSFVMQQFLDKNPVYWCFVPMSSDDAVADNRTHPSLLDSTTTTADINLYNTVRQAQQRPKSPTFSKRKQPLFFQALLPIENVRSYEECVQLTTGVPKPPYGYMFSRRQIDQQMEFFKFKKETHSTSWNLIDCHQYTIIAVLPQDCSYELRQFIKALFITHAETNMNTSGRLTIQKKSTWPFSTNSFDHSLRGLWFKELVRERCSSQTK